MASKSVDLESRGAGGTINYSSE
uniref:Uncharacterized protein n=1 Tax=Physcomitrium patens TaxID=3218 RepID=A0A7I4FWI5_PHYPA